MELGSPEHKAQMCEALLKDYYENIWKDEMYLMQLDQVKGDKRKEIAAIDLKIEAKEFKTKNEGEKAKFVAGQELKHIDQEIATVTEKVQKIWPSRIELVKRYMGQN